MPSEQSRPERPRNRKSIGLPAPGRPQGKNTEAELEQESCLWQAILVEVSLEDGVDGLKGIEVGPQHSVTLKNGETVDVRGGLAAWETLNDMLDTHPDLFKVLLAKVRGEEISLAMQRELRRALLTLPSGEVRESIRNVLLSGYTETKDGPVIVNPFKLEIEADRKAFTEAESLGRRNDARIGIVDPFDDQETPPSSSR